MVYVQRYTAMETLTAAATSFIGEYCKYNQRKLCVSAIDNQQRDVVSGVCVDTVFNMAIGEK